MQVMEIAKAELLRWAMKMVQLEGYQKWIIGFGATQRTAWLLIEIFIYLLKLVLIQERLHIYQVPAQEKDCILT
jgi:hypothetical protein